MSGSPPAAPRVELASDVPVRGQVSMQQVAGVVSVHVVLDQGWHLDEVDAPPSFAYFDVSEEQGAWALVVDRRAGTQAEPRDRR